MKEFIHSEAQAETAVLVALVTKTQDERKTKEYLDELAFLAETAGAVTVKRFTQRLDSPNSVTYVGKGKLDEIRDYIKAEEEAEREVGMVIFDDELSAKQLRNIEKELQVKILDRTSLKGSVGLRGPGETQLEMDRRIILNRMSLLKQRLADIDRQKSTQRKNRGRLIRVALVGYTNVGKSTLINLLAKADVFAENKLFATLDTTVRKVIVGNLPFLLSDTVGFIRKIPTDLVDSFKSTLDEVREADLLLHVVDISHPDFEEQIDVVNRTLADLGCAEKPVLLVFNKTDAYTWTEKDPDDLTPPTRENVSLDALRRTWMARMGEGCIFISARERLGIDELKDLLYKRVRELHVQKYPYNDFLFQQYDDEGHAV